jgi:PAS domain S-box-containing protein
LRRQKEFLKEMVHERTADLVSTNRKLSREIDERKKAVETLKESEKKYRTLFRAMINGFALHEIICDPQGQPVDYRFLEINPAFEKITGLKASEVVGKTVLEILPGIEQQWIETYGAVALTGQPAFFTDYAEEMDKHFEVTVFRAEPNQFACILADITEKKRLEEQLNQAQKMESIGRLAGGMAHDYNNALGAIIGFTELALDEVASAGPLQNDLNEVLRAAKRAADITRQLLAFARKQTIAPRVFDLNEQVEDTFKMLRRLIGEDIDLTWLPGTSPCMVNMDISQVDQILVNLCINARDAISDVGKITIETKRVHFDDDYCANHAGFLPGDFILLAVSDNGCGMDGKLVNDIFEPFFTTKDVDKGTGLGLSTVYGIVKQNNGFINVYSEPDRGTTFKIYVSQFKGEQAVIEPKTKTALPVGRGETVLLVEDDLSILELTRKILDSLGYNVLTANTPSEALALAEKNSAGIHLLVTDVIMPQMNGRELAERLQRHYPNLRELFMSGYTADAIAHHGVLEKGLHFIQKPFSRENLAKIVRRVLDDPENPAHD